MTSFSTFVTFIISLWTLRSSCWLTASHLDGQLIAIHGSAVHLINSFFSISVVAEFLRKKLFKKVRLMFLPQKHSDFS